MKNDPFWPEAQEAAPGLPPSSTPPAALDPAESSESLPEEPQDPGPGARPKGLGAPRALGLGLALALTGLSAAALIVLMPPKPLQTAASTPQTQGETLPTRPDSPANASQLADKSTPPHTVAGFETDQPGNATPPKPAKTANTANTSSTAAPQQPDPRLGNIPPGKNRQGTPQAGAQDRGATSRKAKRSGPLDSGTRSVPRPSSSETDLPDPFNSSGRSATQPSPSGSDIPNAPTFGTAPSANPPQASALRPLPTVAIRRIQPLPQFQTPQFPAGSTAPTTGATGATGETGETGASGATPSGPASMRFTPTQVQSLPVVLQPPRVPSVTIAPSVTNAPSPPHTLALPHTLTLPHRPSGQALAGQKTLGTPPASAPQRAGVKPSSLPIRTPPRIAGPSNTFGPTKTAAPRPRPDPLQGQPTLAEPSGTAQALPTHASPLPLSREPLPTSLEPLPTSRLERDPPGRDPVELNSALQGERAAPPLSAPPATNPAPAVNAPQNPLDELLRTQGVRLLALSSADDPARSAVVVQTPQGVYALGIGEALLEGVRLEAVEGREARFRYQNQTSTLSLPENP